MFHSRMRAVAFGAANMTPVFARSEMHFVCSFGLAFSLFELVDDVRAVMAAIDVIGRSGTYCGVVHPPVLVRTDVIMCRLIA